MNFYQQHASQLCQTILSKVQSKIISGNILVQEKCMPFKYQQFTAEEENKLNLWRQMQEVRHKKYLMIQELQGMQQKQFQLQKSRIIKKPSLQKKPISHYTFEQKKQIIKIYKNAKLFEQQLNHKCLVIDKQVQQYRKKKQQEQQLEKQKNKIKRKEKAKFRLQKQYQQNKLRMQQCIEGQRKINQISKQKKLYEQMQEEWLEREEELKRKQQQQSRKIGKQHRLQLQWIKQHQQKYNKIIKINKQKRINKIQQYKLNGTIENGSKFWQIIKQEEEKKQRQRMQRIKSKIQRMESKKQYGKIIKKQAQKMEIKKIIGDQKNIQKQEIKQMNHQQRNLKGNQYMRSISLNLPKIHQNKIQKQQIQHQRYKNYLKTRKITKYGNQPAGKAQLVKLRKILKKQNLDPRKKLQLSRKYVEQINAKSNNLYFIANAKIQVVKQLYNYR